MKTFKITACLCALFLLGAASGFGLSKAGIPFQQKIRKASETALAERLFEETQRRLQLTNEQVPVARKSYKELESGLREIRGQTTVKIRDLMTQKGTEIWKTLTPEQRAEFKKLNEERRERWSRLQQ
jgi:Spy/CpxP family protein refolding chaperone